MATELEHIRAIESHFEFEQAKMKEDCHLKEFQLNIAMANIEHSIRAAKKVALDLENKR